MLIATWTFVMPRSLKKLILQIDFRDMVEKKKKGHGSCGPVNHEMKFDKTVQAMPRQGASVDFVILHYFATFKEFQSIRYR